MPCEPLPRCPPQWNPPKLRLNVGRREDKQGNSSLKYMVDEVGSTKNTGVHCIAEGMLKE
eukprot:1141847-Pelagomonas_calceolata.AAC.4